MVSGSNFNFFGPELLPPLTMPSVITRDEPSPIGYHLHSHQGPNVAAGIFKGHDLPLRNPVVLDVNLRVDYIVRRLA